MRILEILLLKRWHSLLRARDPVGRRPGLRWALDHDVGFGQAESRSQKEDRRTWSLSKVVPEAMDIDELNPYFQRQEGPGQTLSHCNTEWSEGGKTRQEKPQGPYGRPRKHRRTPSPKLTLDKRSESTCHTET